MSQDHDGCMHPDFCVADKAVLAELRINPAILPLGLDDPARRRLARALGEIATGLNVWAAELDKGWHSNSVRARFLEFASGLGPDVVVRTDELVP